MTHASLFSGIGGFDLATRRIGRNYLFKVAAGIHQSIRKRHRPPGSLPDIQNDK